MIVAAMSKGRGGIENRRKTGKRNARWATDVARHGHWREETREGLIFEFYLSRDKADAAAAKWNEEPGYHAIVVPAWYEDMSSSPWETPEGRDEMDAAYRDAGVPRPDWLQQLFDRDGQPETQHEVAVTQPADGAGTAGSVAEPGNSLTEATTASDDDIDPVDAMKLLSDMVTEFTQSGRTVEPLVVLLWSLGGARAFGPRMKRYGDVREELTELLVDWEPEPDPLQAWLELAAWPQWWQIQLPAPTDPAGELALEGGLTNAIYDLAGLDDEWNTQAVAVLRAALESSPELSEVLVAARLAVPAEAVAAADALPYKVAVEQNVVEEYTVEYDALSSRKRRRDEATLQKRYCEYLQQALGHDVCSYVIPIDGRYFRADLYDETTDEQIEVKSSVDRVTMRLALGQILDYARVLRPKLRTVLVPERPGDGLVGLFSTHAVRIAWWSTDTREFTFATTSQNG